MRVTDECSPFGVREIVFLFHALGVIVLLGLPVQGRSFYWEMCLQPWRHIAQSTRHQSYSRPIDGRFVGSCASFGKPYRINGSRHEAMVLFI